MFLSTVLIGQCMKCLFLLADTIIVWYGSFIKFEIMSSSFQIQIYLKMAASITKLLFNSDSSYSKWQTMIFTFQINII